MAEDLITQNTLLRSLVATQEHENQAKDKQRQTLLSTIDHLTAELARLEEELSRRRVGQSGRGADLASQQLKLLKDNNATLNRQFDGLKGKVSSLNADLERIQKELKVEEEEVLRLREENRRLQGEVERGRSSAGSSSQVITLQNEITSYKVKLSTLTTIEQQLKSTSNKVTTLQTTNRQLSMEKSRLEGEVRRVEASNQRLETQNRELRTSTTAPNRNSAELNAMMSAKTALEGEVRQLQGRVEWLEGNNRSLQQEKNDLIGRLRKEEKELMEAKGRLSQLKYNQQTYRSIQTNMQVKDKQMLALQQMITSLKDNKKYQQRVLLQKDEIIVSLQSQLQTLKSSQNHSLHLGQQQLSSLRQENEQLKRQMTEVMAVKSNHQMEMSRATQREQQLMLDLAELRNDRDRLLREREVQSGLLEQAQREIKARNSNLSAQSYYQSSYHATSGPIHEGRRDEEDIRAALQRMQLQISQLKQASHMQSQIIHERPHHDMDRHTHQYRPQSPSKGLHSRLLLSNERDKHGLNKVKWENLQRKISALRNQNESLKRSLFQ